jgi:hypothetical protein
VHKDKERSSFFVVKLWVLTKCVNAEKHSRGELADRSLKQEADSVEIKSFFFLRVVRFFTSDVSPKHYNRSVSIPSKLLAL